MFGKIYRINNDEDKESTTLSVYASFGGLLMRLTGEASYLQGFVSDSNIYMMMKRGKH